MAARRITKSLVDWAAFAERVPPNQMEFFRAFKSKSEQFINRVHSQPEKLPAIDFSMYKSRVAVPGMVEKFEKAYAAMAVPYPKDKGNTLASIDAEEKEANVSSQAFVANLNKTIEDAKNLLEKIDSLPPPEEMTHEMHTDYFPEKKLDPVNNPTLWPHIKSVQPGASPKQID